MKLINTISRGLSTRLAMVVGLLFSFLGQASAADKVYIKDFSIKAGETKEIAIYFDTEATDFKRLKGTLTLPAGLICEDNAYGTNQRVKGNDGRTNGAVTNYRPKTGALSFTGATFSAGTDAFAYITVTASTALAENSSIVLSDFTATNETETVNVASSNAAVTRTKESGGGGEGEDPAVTPAISLSATPSEISVNTGEDFEVEVSLNSNVALNGFQSHLTASKGISVTGVTKSSRVGGTFRYNSTKGNITSLGAGLASGEGAIFTVAMKADDGFSGNASLRVDGFAATTADATSIQSEDLSITVNVIDNSGVGDANVVWFFDSESVVLTAGKSVDVKVSMTSDQDLTGFSATLALPANVTASIAKGELISTDPRYNAESGNIVYLGSALTGLEGNLMVITLTASDVFAADGILQLSNISVTTSGSRSYQPASITMTVKSRDEEAKAAADKIVEELQAELDAAKAYVEENAADVVGDFADDEAAIQEKIDALREQIAADYETNSIVVADVQAAADGISDEIEGMKAAAVAAQAQYEKEQGNEAAYERLSAELDALQEALDAVKAGIDPAVADEFTEQTAAVQMQIDDAKAALDAAKEAVELTAESTLSEKADIEAATQKLADDAAAALEQYNKEVANEAAYDKLKDDIAALRNDLDDAANEIALNYSDVAGDFEDDIDAIEKQIDDLQKDLDDAYAAVSLDVTSELDAEKVAAITEAIDKVVADAEKAHNIKTLVGDVDGDGEVNGVDYRIVLNHVLSGGEYIATYDINGDGKVNVVDASAITNIILYGDWQGKANAGVRALNGVMASLRAEQTGDARGLVLNSSVAYNALQVDVDGIVDENCIKLGAAAAGHTLLTKRLSDGRLRVVVISSDNSAFGNGVLLYVKASVTFGDIVLADNQACAAYLNIDSVTGVNSIRQNINEGNVYDLSGRRLDAMRNGVNIVRKADGTTVKVLRK